MAERITNAKYAAMSGFVALCESKGVKPTKRQASKYRRGYGALRLAARLARRTDPAAPLQPIDVAPAGWEYAG